MVLNGFTRKKVGSMTLGEKLTKLRSDGRISLSEVSKSTKIQVKYLEYLESGLYEKLPAEVYVKGFLRSYANYLGVTDKILIRLYERDRGIRRNIVREENNEEAVMPISFSRFLITPKILAISTSILVGLAITFYFYREVSSFISEPYLLIASPVNGQVIDGNEVIVSGELEKGSEVRINDQPTVVNEAGKFSEKVMILPGMNTITVCAKNKLKKETVKTINVQSNFENNTADNTGMLEDNNKSKNGNGEKIKLEILIVTAPTWVSVKSDDSVVFSGIIEPDSSKEFEAVSKFSVESDKGNNTLVKLNGEDKGRLSEKSEIIKDVIFSKED
jgi:cytoskeletal protein RodZ